MKKTATILMLVLAMLPIAVQAQTPDTIFGRHHQYYYGKWYDQCDRYYDCSTEWPYQDHFYVDEITHPLLDGGAATDYLIARRFTIPGRMAIKGMVALASGQIKPEYLMLFQHDTTAPGNTALLGMTRWDTAARKVMKLPQCIQSMHLGDDSKFIFLNSYEALLDKPMVVDSVFYIAGTFQSDTARILGPFWPPYGPDTNNLSYDTIYPKNTRYYTIFERELLDCDSCINFERERFRNVFPITKDWEINPLPRGCGPFMAIIDSDYYQLTVLSDSVPMGTVAGGGHYVSMTQVEISATPEAGYRFAMWDDGSVENPRTVEVYCDTVFTAIFTEEGNYVVRTQANRPAKGNVSGGGFYAPGQTAVLQATATDSAYRFVGWTDGDTANPRMVVVDRDTLFTALFSSPTGIDDVERGRMAFTLSPNPTHGSVTLTAPKEDVYTVTVFDNSGRQVASTTFAGATWTLDASGLAAGTYYIRLRSQSGEGTKTFVKQ